MRIIFLLGLNFLRTQWIVIVVMLAYVVGMNSFLVWNVQPGETVTFLRIEAIYAMSFVLLVAVPAIHGERRSRRIVAVLSKGIERWQYLGGLLCGCALIAAIFCAAIGLAAWTGALRAGIPSTGLPAVVALVFMGSIAVASTGLFCSTFLHPMLATGIAAALLALPAAARTAGWDAPPMLFPVAEIVRRVTEINPSSAGAGTWKLGAAALIQALLFWAAGALTFARRDVTTSME